MCVWVTGHLATGHFAPGHFAISLPKNLLLGQFATVISLPYSSQRGHVDIGSLTEGLTIGIGWVDT